MRADNAGARYVEACSTSDINVLRGSSSSSVTAGFYGTGSTPKEGRGPGGRGSSRRDRQVALRRDTERLLSLAAELKQNVDKTSPNILSMDVIKKAQEIEKLAKSVKD